MQLPAALFEQIASTLCGEPSVRPGYGDDAKRRQEPRVGVRAGATIIPLTDRLAAAPFEVPVRDLSSGGIRFQHGRRIALDEQFVVLLPQGRESVAVLCQVAYYQPLSDGVYAVGAKFVRILRQPAAEADAVPLPTSIPVRRRAAS
jgi:hypothetical protein